MELIIALISLATALVGLFATLAGKKQVIVIRDGAEGPQVVEELKTRGDKPLDKTATPEPTRLQPEQVRWYDKPSWLALSFILFWPIGLYGLVKSRAVRRSWKIAVFGSLVLSSVIIILFSVTLAFNSSWAYQEAMELARNNPTLIEELGEPIKAGAFVTGSVRVSGSSGEAGLSIPVEGPRKAATLHIVAKMQAGRWRLDLAEANVENRRSRVDLLLGQH
jgi:hypothetical protein